MFKLLGSLFRFIGKSLTLFRVVLANALFVVILIVVFSLLSSAPKPVIANANALVVAPNGVLVDKLSYTPSALDFLMGDPSQIQETQLRDLTTAIKAAANDKEITGLILRLDSLQGGGMSKLEELGQAITAFKRSEKPVIAYSDSYTQQQYFLASYADEIYLNDLGYIGLLGFGIYRNYYQEATNKLSLKFHVFKAGEFKDAVEPYIRNSMSEASKEHNNLWLNSLWQRYTTQIEKSRQLDAGSLNDFVNTMDTKLLGVNGNGAELALKYRLVDAIVNRSEIRHKLIDRFGANKDGEKPSAISVADYLRSPAFPKNKSNNKIGLIVASGVIVPGSPNDGNIGGDSLSQLIRRASNDTEIKALVLRIDSGGGSAFASEIIREELLAAKSKGLKIYLSMSSVAASGGYWIASAANEIWATPSTITGSIGVWSLIPNFSQSLNKLGIHSDGISTSDIADSFNLNRVMSDKSKTIFQASVNNIYSQFIGLVAEARDQSVEDIDSIAQGRVWAGEKALELGLVDKLGSLDDVFSNVAEQLELESYSVKVIERELSPQEMFLRALIQEASVVGIKIQSAILGSSVNSALFRSHSIIPFNDLDPIFQAKSSTDLNTQIMARCVECYAP